MNPSFGEPSATTLNSTTILQTSTSHHFDIHQTWLQQAVGVIGGVIEVLLWLHVAWVNWLIVGDGIRIDWLGGNSLTYFIQQADLTQLKWLINAIVFSNIRMKPSFMLSCVLSPMLWYLACQLPVVNENSLTQVRPELEVGSVKCICFCFLSFDNIVSSTRWGLWW